MNGLSTKMNIAASGCECPRSGVTVGKVNGARYAVRQGNFCLGCFRKNQETRPESGYWFPTCVEPQSMNAMQDCGQRCEHRRAHAKGQVTSETPDCGQDLQEKGADQMIGTAWQVLHRCMRLTMRRAKS